MGALEAFVFDALIAHTVNLFRFEAGVRAQVLALLVALSADLTDKLQQDNLSDFNKQRTTQLLNESNAVIADYYGRIGSTMAGTLADVGAVELAFMAATYASVPVGMALKLPSDNLMKALVSDLLIQSAPSASWWARQAQDTQFKFAQAVRTGIVSGETNQQIIAKVVGKRGEPGFMDISKTNAETLVHTSIMTVTNAARMETYKQNDDVVKGTRWLATLDGHTCPRCSALDWQSWTLDGAALPGTKMPYPGNAPLHYGCRCVQLSVLRDIGIPMTGSRAASDGPVPTGTTFEDWFKNRSVEQQNEQFGKAKAQLWRDGKITLRDMTDMKGRVLTLEELKALDNGGMRLQANTFIENAISNPREKQKALALSKVSDAAIARGDALGVDLRGKSVALDHDGVIHILREHGTVKEVKRGQVPIDSTDIAMFDRIFNTGNLELGNPPIAKDSTKLLGGTVQIGEITYGFASKVRRNEVIPYTLFKRLTK